jgi:transcriptional regulator with XRE-family HTH domain
LLLLIIVYTAFLLLSSTFYIIFIEIRKIVAIILITSKTIAFLRRINMGDRSKFVNSYVGKRIKILRETKGLSQKELGTIVNKGDSTVRMWELGNSEPDNSTLIILANYFNVSVDYLLGRSDDCSEEKALGINNEEQKEKPVADSNGQNEKERRLLEMFRELLPNLQDYLLNTAETLIEASSGGQSKTIPAQSKRA